MNIIVAENSGFCFGVKRAVEMVDKELIKDNELLYSYGPLIHNPQMVQTLEDRGLKTINGNRDEVKNSRLIIRAHGVTKDEIDKIETLNNEIIDTTCPYVKSIHKRVLEYSNKGYTIIIVGDKTHPEVIGINGWCSNSAYLVNSVEDVENIPELDKICVVVQTTYRYEQFTKVLERVKEKGQIVEVFNTICSATRDRQNSTRELSKQVDAMIVLGGYASSNTLKLKEISEKFCKNVFHVETIHEISLQDVTRFNIIGLTAGASTPDCIIEEAVYIMDNFNDNNNDDNNNDMNDMMKAIDDSFTRIHKGEIVPGEVLFVTPSEIMVNINYKSDGIISRDELSNDPDVNPKDLFEPGDEIDVYILRADDGDGNVVLSYKRVGNIKQLDTLEEYYENEEIIEGKVKKIVKGGLIVTVEDIDAFMPASLISVNFVKDMNEYQDQTLRAKIIDFDKRKRRIILSRKAIEKDEMKVKRDALWSKLEIGQIVEGEVQRLTEFGAFVDLGGVDGLIHISDISWNRVKHPSDVLDPDDTVEVKILDLDEERNRISLGLKQTQPRPWDEFEKNAKVDDIVEGKIVNILPFGAFVRLEDGVDGLLHISQISKDHVENPADVLNIGDSVEVKIIDIDLEEKRISLSIRAIEEDKEEKVEEENKASEDTEVEEDNEPTIGDIVDNKE